MSDLGPWAFRAGLKRELAVWRAEGLIDAAAAGKLAARYRLDESGAGVALGAIYLLGSLLVGGGVITFVAWHWAALPGLVQLALVTLLLAGTQLLGHELVRTRRSPRLGHALLVLGTLIFGADVGLVAQLFHVGSSWYGGIGAWALGALAAGLAFGSLPNLVIAALLGSAFLWGLGAEHTSYALYLPWAHALVFGGLALARRSRALLFLAAVGLTGGLCAATVVSGGSAVTALVAGVATSTLPLAVALLAPRLQRLAPLQGVARVAGLLASLPVVFGLSFHDAARELAGESWQAPALVWLLSAGVPLLLAALVALAAGRTSLERQPGTVLALATAPLLLLCITLDPDGSATTIGANLLLVGVGAGCLVGSVRGLERGGFWAGVLLLGLLILSRFFEYQTELWVKALAFVACGVVVLLLGGLFERRLRREEAVHAA